MTIHEYREDTRPTPNALRLVSFSHNACLVFTSNPRKPHAVAWYNSVRRCWCRPGSSWRRVRGVTHWMEIPAVEKAP